MTGLTTYVASVIFRHIPDKLRLIRQCAN